VSATDLALALGNVRALTQGYLSGKPEAFESARALLAYLLQITVMHPAGVLLMTRGEKQREDVRTIGVPQSRQPIPLKDGRYLDVLMQLRREREKEMTKLRAYVVKFQYQQDHEGEDWIFRYEYLRTQRDQHPASHLHVRGSLHASGCLPEHVPLEDVHFPTGRPTIEAVVRCLVEQFNVPTNTHASFWRPVLAESEMQFIAIAHQTPSGPSA
jgi:hypothetical protein